MSGYPDDRFDGPPPDALVRAARGALVIPATFLIISSLIGLGVIAAASVPLVFQPEVFAKFMRDVAAQQPPGPQKDDLEQKVDELDRLLAANRDEFVRRNAFQLALPTALNLFALLGAVLMWRVSVYPVCIIAAVVAIVPGLTGCCVTGMPFGIWALVVLIRPEVKAAFAAKTALPPADPDAQYLR